jgi:putative Mg2+ transporter-C (MgtC) family protein
MEYLNLAAALPLPEVLLRIGFAMAAGLILGLERESHGRAAGLKTTILACVASCIAMILSEDFYRESMNQAGLFRPDRARLAAGILTGIGFLGAGAIIRQGTLVRGVTTAAVLWFITILGLAFGSGHLQLGCIGTAIAMVALFALPYIESHIRKDFYYTITVTLALTGAPEEDIQRCLESAGARVQRLDLDYDVSNQQRILAYDIKVNRSDVIPLSKKLMDSILVFPGVLRVKWG